MEHYVLQNNACNIYEQYFADVEVTPLIQRAFSRTVNVYRDPLITKRRISHLSWSPDQGNRFAASYNNVDFKKNTSSNCASYIWEVGMLSE
jgi:dynein intermediate chain 2